MPTEKQYNYAWNIAHALKIELPQFLNKYAFSAFISEHKEEYEKLISSYKEDYERIKFEQIIQEAENFSS